MRSRLWRRGIKLFDRVGRRIELTEAGPVFLAEARAVLARADAADLALSEFGSLKRGTLLGYSSRVIAYHPIDRCQGHKGKWDLDAEFVRRSATC